MSNPVEQLVETQLKVIDQATGPLNKVAAVAEHTAHSLEKTGHAAAHGGHQAHGAFDQLSHVLSSMGGLGLIVGAGLSLHSAVSSVEEYMGRIKRVKELTHDSAMEADFLFSQARRAGVPYATMERTMFQLSRRGAMLETTMAAAGSRVPGMAKKFEHLGVVMNKGPTKALETMAGAVKKGKIDAGMLMAQFRIPQKDAADMEKFLKHLDPKQLAAARAGKGGYIGEDTFDAFERMEEAQHRINDTWNRIKVTVLSKLFPVAAKMAEGLADRLESALPIITNAMQFIADHMDHIVSAAKVFVAVMTTKKLMGFADSLMGGKGLLVGVKGVVEKLAGSSGMLMKLGMSAGKSAQGAVIKGANMLGLDKLVSPQLLASIGGLGGSLAILAAVAAAVGVAIGLAYLGFKAFQKNINGIGDRISLVWDKIKKRFELMWDSLSKIGEAIAGLFGGDGSLGELVGYIAALSFDWVLEGFDLVVHTIQTIASMLGELMDVVAELWKNYLAEPAQQVFDFIKHQVALMIEPWGLFFDWIGEKLAALHIGGTGKDSGWKQLMLKAFAPQVALGMKFMEHWRKTGRETDIGVAIDRKMAEAEKKKHHEDTREKKPNFDFRGSRFDITQNFAEGFDPDRIAVAFSNDLASLGEMRSQSGFAPMMAAR
jgi:hypothetical protein